MAMRSHSLVANMVLHNINELLERVGVDENGASLA